MLTKGTEEVRDRNYAAAVTRTGEFYHSSAPIIVGSVGGLKEKVKSGGQRL